jgi:uncharacterized phage protein gp47/JayE
MPYQKPSLQQINARTSGDIATRIQGSAPQLRVGLIPGIRYAFSNAVFALYGYLDRKFANAVPHTARGDDLRRWASLWGIAPEGPFAAVGFATVTGVNGTPIPAATVLQYSDESTYTVGATVDIAGGVATLAITADSPGIAGNLAGGAALTFVSPLTGVSSTATVTSDGLTGGAEIDSDDVLLARVEERIQNPPHGGNKQDYVDWAQSVSSNIRAWCFPLYSGVGTVRVFIADSTYVTGPNAASGALVAEVQTFIDSVRPVTVATIVSGVQVSGVTVVAPTNQPVAFTIGGLTAAQQALAQAGLQALFLREAKPEGSIPRQDMVLAVANSIGSGAFTMTAPAADQVAAANHILTVGAFTWL